MCCGHNDGACTEVKIPIIKPMTLLLMLRAMLSTDTLATFSELHVLEKFT